MNGPHHILRSMSNGNHCRGLDLKPRIGRCIEIGNENLELAPLQAETGSPARRSENKLSDRHLCIFSDTQYGVVVKKNLQDRVETSLEGILWKNRKTQLRLTGILSFGCDGHLSTRGDHKTNLVASG